MTRANHDRFWGLRRCERGFTLAEVLVTIILMGLIVAIASSTYWNVVESRRVNSAANQLTADLRLAHSTTINRLVDQEVSLTAGSNVYSMTGSGNRDLDDDPDDDLVTVDTTTTITFKPNGTAEPAGAPITFRVLSAPPDGESLPDCDPTPECEPFHTIEIRPATSRVSVVD